MPQDKKETVVMRPTARAASELAVPTITGERHRELMEFIVTHATAEWIRVFVKQKLIEIERRLTYCNQWVDELEKEPSELVLLRIATELGYVASTRRTLVGEAPRPTLPPIEPEPETVPEPPKRRGRKVKGSG